MIRQKKNTKIKKGKLVINIVLGILAVIWLFPVIFFLFITAIMSRIIYKKTRNPYLAGFINAMVIVMISCSNTFTSLSAGTLIATTF